jgi:hypothetical protein
MTALRGKTRGQTKRFLLFLLPRLVWLGKQLLLNEIKGDGPKLDVVLLDLASGHSSKKFENNPAVFGWVAQRQQATNNDVGRRILSNFSTC